MQAQRRKHLGAYFTPDAAAAALVKWAVRRPGDALLDPSAGDGRFLALHKPSMGVEADPASVAVARARAPWAKVHEGDFFAWAETSPQRFECAAGNPPFIRYQRFSGELRVRALRLCERLGATFSALTSSWAPFLVAAASVLKPGGRMAFVVPAEIGHAPYAAPLVCFLLSRFADVRVLAVREKVFPELSEDVWLLYASGFGGSSDGLLLSTVERFTYADTPPSLGRFISNEELRRWNYRLRPFLLPESIQQAYHDRVRRPATVRLGEIARVGIGYVTGANEFFHLRPSQAAELGIPADFLQASVRNGRVLPKRAITSETVSQWIDRNEPCLLLRLPRDSQLPSSVRRYLDSDSGMEARDTYKCRTRDPWYSVPDVSVPNAFLSYMSGNAPTFVANFADCVGTNSVHTVRMTADIGVDRLHETWGQPLTALSCELEGHPLGGGMLKIEPREAQKIALSLDNGHSEPGTDDLLLRGIGILRDWRHCGA